MLTGKGGWWHTWDDDLVRSFEDGWGERARLLFEMAYRIAKEIGACAATLGEVDAIVLTGGLAYNDRFTGLIRERWSSSLK